LQSIVGKPALDGEQVEKHKRPSQHGLQRSFMKIYQPIAGLCLAALLSACGGGGGDAAPAATPIAAASFPMDAAYTKAMTNGVNLNGTAIDGADTWTMSASIAPASDAMFEGVVRKKSIQALTIKKNGSVLSSETISSYYSINPFTTYGSSSSGGTYAVQTSPAGAFPTTAKVGDSGSLGISTTYTSSSKTTVQSTTQGTWTLEADTATTAFGCANIVMKNASGAQIGTGASCYKIDTNGNALGMRFTVSVPGLTLVFK
jgi:hypothetical protein